MPQIIDHNSEWYKFISKHYEKGDIYNGAFYYSKEICKFFIPNIKTDRNWITVNTPTHGFDHSIVFIHNNRRTEQLYDWLKGFKDLILVCGVPSTMQKVAHLGTPIYLPLSVDVEEVEKYKAEKTREEAFAGRLPKLIGNRIPKNCDIIGGISREMMLERMARYKKIYAVGRTAIEAKILGCEIGVYDDYFPDPSVWKILDSRDAVKILQKELDKVEGLK